MELSNLDEEVTTSANVVTDIIKSVKKTQADTTGLRMSQVPQTVFPTIEIPDQFNDHNLTMRVLDVDALFEGLTDKQVKSANEEIGVKKSKGKKLLGGLGKAALGNDYTGYFLRLSKKK